MANNYKTLNSQGVENPAQRQEIYDAERDKANAAAVAPATPTGPETYSQYERLQSDGTWSQATQRPVAAGTSGADEQFLSDQSYAKVQQYKADYAAAQNAWNEAKALGNTDAMAQFQAQMDAAHKGAESERARAGYSGGTDGSMYVTGMDYLHQQEEEYYDGHGSGGTGGSGAGGMGGGQSDLKGLLDQWRDAATQQQNNKIDYAVAKAVADLERALADAQPQFKEQAESVAKEERQALDNSALYAEARGDKGGIGQAQYNEIQAAAAQNHLAVQQAQTKLSTDTARQIADLRAQGEFQKADAALQIAQTYLSQLISLEQWAAEFGLSQAQFQESIRQWEAEFSLAMQKFQVDTDLAYGSATGRLPSTGQLTLQGQSQLADMGAALLEEGVMPSAEQLSAMGMTSSQAQQYLTNKQLQAASRVPGTGTGGSADMNEAFDWLYESGYTDKSKEDAIRVMLKDAGLDEDWAIVYIDNGYESLKLAEAENRAAGLLTRAQWESRKKTYDAEGVGDAAVAQFDTYEQYKENWLALHR